MGLPTDVHITEARASFSDFALRTPLVLSTGKITGICQATATVRVEDGRGRSARGYGAIFLGDLWAWPSEQVASPQRVEAMKTLCEAMAKGLPAAGDEYAHPLEHGIRLFETYLEPFSARVASALSLPEAIPHLAAAVCLSPFDAALHDAFGRLHGINAYAALDHQFLPATLDRWLGASGQGRHVSEFFRASPEKRVAGWHLVSKGDPLTFAQETDAVEDGLPNSLQGWIEREGVFCLKVKVSGTDVRADVARTVDVHRVASEVHHRRKTGRNIVLEVDSNEACPSAEIVVEYLHRLREASPAAFDALLFVEQPTPRDLRSGMIDLRAVSALKPVLIDEALQSLESLGVAAELGWSGAALKTCKGHSFTLLCIAWCELRGWPYAIVDLTNPGVAAVHAAVLAARCRPMMGLELNCRQFVPAANASLSRHMPGLARMRDGWFDLSGAGPVGLGYPPAMAASPAPGCDQQPF